MSVQLPETGDRNWGPPLLAAIPALVAEAVAGTPPVIAAAAEAAMAGALPSDLKFAVTDEFNRPPAAQASNSLSNGERWIPWRTVAVDGTLTKLHLRVKANPGNLSTFDIRVTTGKLASKTDGAKYTARAVSSVVTVNTPAIGETVTVPVNLAVRAGDYLAIEVQSGITLGYRDAAGAAGFSYLGNLGNTVFATAAGGEYNTQALPGRDFGIGFTVDGYVLKPVASREQVATLATQVAGSVQTINGVIPASVLPPELKESAAQTNGLPAAAASNVNANGERFINYTPAGGDGRVTSVQLYLRQNAGNLATFQVRVTVGSLTAKAVDGVYTIRKATAVLTVNAPAVGGTVTVPVGLDILTGEYIAIEVQSGIGLGYTNGGTGEPGFGYRYGLGANAFAVAEGATWTVQQSFPNGTRAGIGFTLALSTLKPVATKAQLDALASSVAGPLFGKKLVAIGDSMVRGHTLIVAEGWLALIAGRNAGTYVNAGINGTFLTNRLYNGQQGVVERYTTLPNDADYVLVFAGTNDAANLVTLGAANSTDPAEFNGALNVLLAGLITKYPAKKIGFITPYRRNANYPAYADAIKARCAEHGVPVFDNITEGGVDWTNAAQRAAITLDDTYHLNAAGMAYVSTKYENWMRGL